VLPMPVRVNVTLTDLSRISQRGLLNASKEKTIAQNWVAELDMRIASLEQAALNLSGGNQQKLVMAKRLFRDAEVLMLDEPTQARYRPNRTD
jgi:ABC-type sugar transport system ATPase subunit